MWWRFLGGLARTAVFAHRTVTAFGVATVIAVGVYDFLKARNSRE